MGDSSAADSACYLEVVKRLQTLPDATSPWRVTRGILDSSNRDSLLVAAPVPVGTQTRFTWPLQPTEHVFKAGHQIGIVLTGNYGGFGTAGTTGTVFTVDATVSKVILPIVGGYATAAASGGFPDGVAPTLAGVPADIAVDAPDASGVGGAVHAADRDRQRDAGRRRSPASRRPGSVFPVGVTHGHLRCARRAGQPRRGDVPGHRDRPARAAERPGHGRPAREAPATALDLGRRLLVVRAGAQAARRHLHARPPGAAALRADPGRRRQDARARGTADAPAGRGVRDRGPAARRRRPCGSPGARAGSRRRSRRRPSRRAAGRRCGARVGVLLLPGSGRHARVRRALPRRRHDAAGARAPARCARCATCWPARAASPAPATPTTAAPRRPTSGSAWRARAASARS